MPPVVTGGHDFISLQWKRPKIHFGRQDVRERYVVYGDFDLVAAFEPLLLYRQTEGFGEMFGP